MDDHHKQPEGASRQAVGALMGALVGFGTAARQIFADYGATGQTPWVECVGTTMIGGVVGLLLATLFAGGAAAEETKAEPAEDAPKRHPEENMHDGKQETRPDA